ncbi:hypothetical protein KAR91_46100, partial [Candidatus Pacearchaeota archaeon]|nr:hypothetical protein [Candidatus Pacearchaeota archaeon]
FDVADITRINARIIDDLSTNPVGDHVDIGAHEYSASPVTPPAVETITIVHLCFIDESWGSYETQASKYETDLNYYRSLMLSGMADEFKSGALAIENGIAALLPTGADAPDDVVILDVPDLPFEEDELYGDASAYFETICDGADPDYIILSRDTSSLSLPDMEEGSYGYDEFQTWLASTYPDAEIEERTFSSSGTTEYWLAEMAVALLDVSEQHDLD